MTSGVSLEKLELVREGVANLAEGAKLNIIAAVVTVIGAIAMATVAYTALTAVPGDLGPHPGPGPKGVEGHAAALTTLAGVLAILLVSAILSLLGWLRFKAGAEALARYNPDAYGIGATGAKLVLIGFAIAAISLLAGIALLLAGSAAGIGALVGLAVGGLLVLIGAILFIVMFFRMDEIDPDYKTAGIILIIGFVLSLIKILAVIGAILELIGFYMVYKTSKNVVKRLEETPMGASPAPQTLGLRGGPPGRN